MPSGRARRWKNAGALPTRVDTRRFCIVASESLDIKWPFSYHNVALGVPRGRRD
jgi:hypothetical protein